jgi:hypothetical protein
MPGSAAPHVRGTAPVLPRPADSPDRTNPRLIGRRTVISAGAWGASALRLLPQGRDTSGSASGIGTAGGGSFQKTREHSGAPPDASTDHERTDTPVQGCRPIAVRSPTPRPGRHRAAPAAECPRAERANGPGLRRNKLLRRRPEAAGDPSVLAGVGDDLDLLAAEEPAAPYGTAGRKSR